MKLKDLSVGQEFKFCNGNGKIWQKKNDHNGITEYNSCVCYDDLSPNEKSGLMLLSSSRFHKMNKEADVIIV